MTRAMRQVSCVMASNPPLTSGMRITAVKAAIFSYRWLGATVGTILDVHSEEIRGIVRLKSSYETSFHGLSGPLFSFKFILATGQEGVAEFILDELTLRMPLEELNLGDWTVRVLKDALAANADRN